MTSSKGSKKVSILIRFRASLPIRDGLVEAPGVPGCDIGGS